MSVRLEDGLTIVDCFGGGRERGLAHGESARRLIHEGIARWQEATLAGQPRGTAMRDYAARFVGGTGLMAAMEGTVPDLVEEIRGIADGAALPYEIVAAYNLMDEQWWYDLDTPPQAEPGCSLVALSDTRRTVLGQNMDLPGFMDGSQIVLRLREPGRPETLVLSSAGLIGLTGVSRAGFGICVNTLLMLNHSSAGLPVAAVFRHALAQDSAAGAIAALKSLRHASGQHYAVADRHEVTGVECSAGGCSVSSPAGRSILTHTNHPLASGDVDAASLAILERRGRVDNSRRRLAFLDGRVGGLAGADDVIALLADPSTPICVTAEPARPSHTFGSVVFEMAEETTAYFCLAHPTKADWQAVSWSDDR